MNNPFNSVKEKKKNEKIAQQQREERLAQLEESRNQSRKRILHPVKAQKERKEIKDLKKEIASFEEKRKYKRVLLGLFSFLAALFLIIFIAAKNSPADTNQNTASPSDAFSSDAGFDNESLNNDTVQSPNGQKTSEILTSSISIDERKQSEVISENGTAETSYTAVDYEVGFETDYSHIDTERMTLGNNEIGTVIITASPSTIKFEDFYIEYNNSMLSYTLTDTVANEDKDSISFTLQIKAISSGASEIVIFAIDDFIALDDNTPVVTIPVYALDKEQGRVVFVTYGGEKYHFNENCPGDSAFKTTLYDAECAGYEPCKKCAN